MNNRAPIAALTLAAVAFSSFGCSTESQVRSNGDTIVFHQQQEPESLNPVISNMMATVDAAAPILEGLSNYTNELELVPVLAEKIPTVENGLVKQVGDGMVVTWPLKKGVKWHDGKPFTAEDVKFTFEVLMHPATKVATRQGYDKITKAEVLDPHTIRFTYSELYAPHKDLFGTVLPKHKLASYIADPKGDSINKAPFNRDPIGTGPFKFKSWVSGDHISYEANADYWRGAPSAKFLKMRIIPDENAAFTLLKSGELDIYQSASINQYEALKKLNHVNVVAVPSLTWEHLDFNLKREVFQDIRVRRAIAYAINKQQISEKIYHGIYKPAHSDVAPLSWAYNKNIEDRYPYDPEKSKALLDEAGWKPGVDGIRVKDGERFTIKISTTAGRKPRELTELVLKYYFKKIGIELLIDNHPGPVLFGAYPDGIIKGGKYDLSMSAWVAGPDPDNLSLWHSAQTPPNGQNSLWYKNTELDKLLEQGTKVLEQEKRKQIYHRTAEILADDVPMIPLLYWADVHPVNNRVKNFKPNPSNAGNLWNVYEWRVEEAPAMKASKEG
ncbi:MAG: peptide ABC transporter substrate-binding protein [Candidatus Sericytochromatia bacterium]